MNTTLKSLLLIIVTCCTFLSCEKETGGIVDENLNQSFLQSLQVTPSVINTDTMLVGGGRNPNDLLTVTMTARVQCTFAAGTSGRRVVARILKAGSTRVLSESTLLDDGLGADQIAGDGVYSQTVTFQLRRIETGYYELHVLAIDQRGSESNILIRRITVLRTSRAPVISNLVAPDTVVLPASGARLIFLSLAVADSDGLGDVAEVYFRNLDSPSDTTKKFFLFDDGQVRGVSGDSTAGDGIYSVQIQLPFNTTPKTYRFAFEASNQLGLTSNSILHWLTVRLP